MLKVSSRDFQKSYAQLLDATEVTSWNQTIGVWIPVDSPLYASLPKDDESDELKPATQTVRRTLPNGQVAVRQSVRIIDSVAISRQNGGAREAWRTLPPATRRGR
jgi:hypothetical protein